MNPTGPKIVFLSGPSSSGKTTSSRQLEVKGWIHLEADAERATVQIKLLKTNLLDKIMYLESHFTDQSSLHLIEAIRGTVNPNKAFVEPEKYEQIRQELYDYINSRPVEVDQAILIHMLDKAIDLKILGKNVILDHVPLINDRNFSSHHITKDSDSLNLWCYRDIKIEQQLKYVPVEILMRNVIRRNHNPEEHRSMTMVLIQYGDRFKASTDPKELNLGTMVLETLKKWIERAVKIDFFDINANHGFRYDISVDGDIDEIIQKRLEQFEVEMNNPQNAIDPQGKMVDLTTIETLKEKKLLYVSLQDQINAMTDTLFECMKIPNDVSEVNLTFRSSSGIKPTIIY